MPLLTRVRVTDVLAGSGSSVSEVSLETAPGSVEYGSVRFPHGVPEFDFALSVQGRSMEHADIQNRDTLICKEIGEAFSFEEKDRLVFDVAGFPELQNAHQDWMCLRQVREVNGKMLRVSSWLGGEERVSDVSNSFVKGIVLRGYSHQIINKS